MKVKVGDKVKVLAGKDKGKEGKIVMTLKQKDKVVVEGVNIVKKHLKPRYTNESGSIVEVEAPIHVSNVKKIDDSKLAKTAKTTKTVKKDNTEKKEKAEKTAKKSSTSRKSKES